MAEAHAPGKLILCGEYAVLHGAPAIAVAVDVRARAAVTATTGPCRLAVPDAGTWSFEWQAEGAPRWIEPPSAGHGQLLEAVAATLAAKGMVARTAAQISLDSRAFRGRGDNGAPEKLGLGSSAAIAVALTGVMLAAIRGGAPERADVLALALDAHRRLQGGSGSGVDVAAAVHGGVVMLDGAHALPVIRPLAWPRGLECLAVWSGQSASTPAMLGRFERFHREDPARFERHVGELRRLAGAAVEAWESARLPELLRALADYDDGLRAVDDGAHLGIYTPAHHRLAEIAGAAGAVYKISGAGGGDFGVAFADSAAVMTTLATTLAAAGALTRRVAAGVPGVAVIA